MLGPRQVVYRASSSGVEVRLRVNVDAAWIVIKAPRSEARVYDIPERQVGTVAGEMQAVDSPEKSKSFVSTIQARFAAASTP